MLQYKTTSELKNIYSLILREKADKENEDQIQVISKLSEHDNVKFSLSSNAMNDIHQKLDDRLYSFVPFKTRLSEFIRKSGYTKDSDFYKKCGLTRQHFSKIMGGRPYLPKKRTIMIMALTLKLGVNEAEELLSSAGYAFSDSDKTDWVVRYCIENNIYDLPDVNEALAIFQELPLL